MLKDDILKLLKEDAEFRKQVEEILGISFINVTLADLKDILKGLLASMDKLKSSVDQLVDAQRRAEERIAKLENAVEQLVEAQKRTDERITKLEESTKKLEQAVQELIEAQKKHDERITKLEESIQKLVDAQRRAEERIAKLENAVEQLVEAQKRTDERITKLEEVTMKLVESQLGMQNEIRELRKALGSMGKRWGRDFEKLIIEIVDELAKQEGLDLKYVNKFTYKDDNGLFGLKGVEYDVDLLIKDTKVYLIEIKSYVEKDDVNWAAHKFNVIEKALGLKNTIKMIFAVDATNLATKKGEELGIKVVYGSQSEEEEKGEVKVG
ncbi:DUF3782 domain-containing protein [Saccharolobus solfataricus]|uniref:DUF3782 domain-containing protein n=2 Tax=Saccharolobus solfataricus TaxID=2287 RepID=A0A0E3MDD7_SACSO|nr:DUF3782 domain-containing protein [Saccharolobus solfataricus]AKA74424.1 DUF3782 domain-containing protein [Saccharolobus solfataricus]AKA77119.1 DUF3782 domain-containing protein [Saccharolobus solfataricus]AKA79812.1 DUF3782 domain-containing protein [Saccharolobus solfataricus]AZF68902.1 DUF3782 domain-containing protein [Saccharolobus solfataricus]AZF71522.1 DUF3782 domain-containing protein [Saccharolobus solfataricus]